MSDFDSAMAVEDNNLNSKAGRKVLRPDIRRRQSYDILYIKRLKKKKKKKKKERGEDTHRC
jgi:hypothetical protein